MENICHGFTGRPDYLTEWEYFVIRHQHKGNLLLHLVSLVMWTVTLSFTLFSFSWMWLGLFLISPSIGVLGHHLYDDGKVRSQDFIRPHTLIFLAVIFVLILAGRYQSISQKVIQKILSHRSV